MVLVYVNILCKLNENKRKTRIKSRQKHRVEKKTSAVWRLPSGAVVLVFQSMLRIGGICNLFFFVNEYPLIFFVNEYPLILAGDRMLFLNPYAATIASSGFIIHVLRMDLKASQPWSNFSRWWMIMAIVMPTIAPHTTSPRKCTPR